MFEIAQSLFEKTGELSQAAVQVQAALGLIIGLGIALLGFKFRRFWLTLLPVFPGLAAGGTLGLSLHILFSTSDKFSAMVASTVLGALGGALMFALIGFLLPRAIEVLLFVLTSLLVGSLIQDFLQSGFGMAVLFAAVGLLIFGLSLWAHRPVLIVVTSLFGSMLFIQGLAQMLNPQFGTLLAELPFTLIWSDSFDPDAVNRIREAISPGYRFYLFLGILLFLLSLPLQFVFTRTRDDMEEDF